MHENYNLNGQVITPDVNCMSSFSKSHALEVGVYCNVIYKKKLSLLTDCRALDCRTRLYRYRVSLASPEKHKEKLHHWSTSRDVQHSLALIIFSPLIRTNIKF